MRKAARLQAAIEVLKDIETHHRPASQALADWGRSHRFAGSGDRAVIGNLVYDALRRRVSLAWRMNTETPRALVLGVAVFLWGETPDSLAKKFTDDEHAPEPLNEAEIQRLTQSSYENAPGWVLADIPEWLEPAFEENFGEDFIKEGQALSERPPTDLRVNTLKSEREKIMKALKRFHPKPTPLSPYGMRLLPTKAEGRSPNVLPEAGYQKGWFEVQDEGSQVTASLVFAQAGEQILDYCAGSGGKTLALAAEMNNKGQLFAYDADRTRLAPIYDRLKRAGTRNVQVISPNDGRLEDLKARMDRVVVDAPCTGSGVWRRRPDAKWRLSDKALQERMVEQRQVLQEASAFVRPGGYLCYITCSVLAEENERQIYTFLERNPEFELLSTGEVWEDLFAASHLKPWSSDECTVTLTPASTGTDGFFFAVLERSCCV